MESENWFRYYVTDSYASGKRFRLTVKWNSVQHFLPDYLVRLIKRLFKKNLHKVSVTIVSALLDIYLCIKENINVYCCMNFVSIIKMHTDKSMNINKKKSHNNHLSFKGTV